MILRPLHVRALVLVTSVCGVFFCTSLARGLDPQNPPKPGAEGRGDAPQGGPERPRGPRGERGPPSLHQSMEQLGRAMEQVEKTIGDATKSEETITGLGRMIQCAGGSVAGMPKSGARARDTRAAFKNTFRREMLLMTRQLVDIELSVLDGKHPQAAEMFKKVADATPRTRSSAAKRTSTSTVAERRRRRRSSRAGRAPRRSEDSRTGAEQAFVTAVPSRLAAACARRARTVAIDEATRPGGVARARSARASLRASASSGRGRA